MDNSSTSITNVNKEVDKLSINIIDTDKIDYLDIGKKEATGSKSLQQLQNSNLKQPKFISFIICNRLNLFKQYINKLKVSKSKSVTDNFTDDIKKKLSYISNYGNGNRNNNFRQFTLINLVLSNL